MRGKILLGIIPLVAVWVVAAADAQITSNPIPAPIVKRGLAVEIKDLVRLPDTRGIRPADQDVSPAGWARVSYVRDLPDGRRFANDSRGFLYLIDAEQPAAGVCERRRGVSECGLQPAGERIHRLRLSSGIRAKRPVLHGARRARAGQSEDARLHPARVRAEGRDLPQHHHGVARDESGGQRVRGHAARAPSRSARRREPHASDGRGRVQPDGEARRCRTTDCSTPAAAITDSATAADRTRAIPPRRSASIRS